MQKGKNVFSDEQIFTFEAKFNPQNDRVLAQHSEDVPEDMLTIYCISVKNFEISFDFCETGCQSQHKCVH